MSIFPIYRLARPSAKITVFDADATLDDYMEQAWYAVIVRKDLIISIHSTKSKICKTINSIPKS